MFIFIQVNITEDYYCPDCGAKIDIPEDVEEGEIITCPCCGLEFIVKIEIDGYSLNQLVIEGEDFGE